MAIALTLITSESCSFAIGNTPIKPSKKYVTKKVEIKNINSISASTSVDVVYTQSQGKAYAEVYAPDNIIPYIKVQQSGNKLNSNHITVYNQDGAVNFSNVASGHNNNNRIDLEFWINDENDHTDYLWVTTIADIDVKQKFSYGSTQIIGLGGLVSVHDGVIQGSDGADLNGPSSAPNGMTVLSLHENHFWMALQDDGGSAYYPMIAVFGRAGNVEPTIIPDKPTLAYHHDTFYPIIMGPSDSVYTTTNLAVNTPTPETANYTLHNLTVTTQAEKGATQVNDNSDVIAEML